MSNITKMVAVLGVVAGVSATAMPLSSYAVQSGPVKVVANIDSTISVTSSESEVNVGTLTPDGQVGTGSTNITVTTSEAKGYNLAIQDTDASNDMVNTTDSTAVIAAGAPAQGASNWGFKAGTVTAWTAVPKSTETAKVFKTTSSAAASDVTKVEFGVSAAAGLKPGTYEDSVVFIAQVNE